MEKDNNKNEKPDFWSKTKQNNNNPNPNNNLHQINEKALNDDEKSDNEDYDLDGGGYYFPPPPPDDTPTP